MILLFDVDGVLTDRSARPNRGVLLQIAELADRGARLAFVTGRSRAWLDAVILSEFRELERTSSLDGALFVGEHGLVHGSGANIEAWDVDVQGAIHDQCRVQLRSAIEETALGRFIEWDATKECVATFEIRHDSVPDIPQSELDRALDRTCEIVQQVVDASGMECAVVRATYAVDAIPRGFSKLTGVTWVLGQMIGVPSSAQVSIFGDSAADVMMAEGCVSAGFEKMTFYWLGSEHPPGIDARVIVPPYPFDLGTDWALSRLLNPNSTS